MRRSRLSKLLSFLIAAFVAFASFGPQATHAHAHSVSDDGDHDHDGHHDADHEDDHDGPSLSDGVAHVHAAWLGFGITFSSFDGANASDSSLSVSACLSLADNLGKATLGPLKERVPWPEFFVGPESFLIPALAHPSFSDPRFFGAADSCALARRTQVLRC